MSVSGTPRRYLVTKTKGTWGSAQFVKGSALHEAVKAGPDGSSFVNPSTLPAASGSSPAQAPLANNWVSS